MREKTSSDGKDGRAGDGAGISRHPFCLASLLLASSMENEDAFECISFHGKNPISRPEEFGEI